MRGTVILGHYTFSKGDRSFVRITFVTEAAFLSLDYWIAACLAPLALWILLSGFDDLFIDVVFLLSRGTRFGWPSDSDLGSQPSRRIAIFVPLWREHSVIARMLAHNLSVIEYDRYDVFVGVYPNDPADDRGGVGGARPGRPHSHYAMPARRPDLESRLPELDLSRHGGV